MSEDIGMNKHNNVIPNNDKIKSILLVTDNTNHYQQLFNKYNLNNYRKILVDWNDILTLTNSNNYTKYENLEFVILDIPINFDNINQISNTITIAINEIKKIFSDKKIFFILPYQSMIETFLSLRICKQEDIRIQPFSVFDLVDLISITNKKDRFEQLKLKDHCMHTYSSIDDKIKDIIKFLKIGIKNNEMTLLLLSRDIDLSYLKSQMTLNNIDINKLQNEGLLKIAHTEEYYLSFNKKDDYNNNKENNVTVDKEKINKIFHNLTDRITSNERKKGLRVFAMLDCFFEYGLIDELLDYECQLSPYFYKSLLGICAYKDKHIEQLSEVQIKRLVLTHGKVLI
jgi:hypothetical protein